VALHGAGEALALRLAGDVDEVAGGEEADVQRLADLVLAEVVDAELTDDRDLGKVLQNMQILKKVNKD
jgi:hypothetical protein